MENMEKNLTQGSIFKNIVIFSLPFLLSYFLQTLYGMADLFIVGQFDEVAAITAVANGSQVMHMLTVIIVGLAMVVNMSLATLIGTTTPFLLKSLKIDPAIASGPVIATTIDVVGLFIYFALVTSFLVNKL